MCGNAQHDYQNRLIGTAMALILSVPPLHKAVGDDWRIALPAVIDKLRHYRNAWEQHPQFEHLRQFPELAWIDFEDETWAEVLVAFRHKPGVDGLEHSFVVGDVREMGAIYAWATRTRIGDFDGIYALPHDFACDPENPVMYPYTHEGRARGYHARMELKRLLPAHLRKYVGKYRRAKKGQKYFYLAEPLPCNGYTPHLDGRDVKLLQTCGKNLSAQPEWYRARTKADLWVEKLRYTNPVLYAQIDYWIDPKDFYLAATGQMKPTRVEGCFKRLPNSIGGMKQLQLL